MQGDSGGGSEGKEFACNAGNPGLIPGLGRSPGEGNGNPLQYSCLENSTDRGAWWVTVYGVAKSRTRLSDQHFHFQGIKTPRAAGQPSPPATATEPCALQHMHHT